MREGRPRFWCWGVLGSKVRSAAQGPFCLGGARGSARSVYTPPSLLPQTCQLGTATASTASPGCQFCFVTWVSVTASLNLSFLPWNVGITPLPPCSWEGYMVGDATLIPALAASKNPRGVSARPGVGGDTPGPSLVGRQAGGPLVSARVGSGPAACRTDVGGGRPLSRQTPESQFPGAASTTGKGGGGWGRGGEGSLGSGRRAEIPVVAVFGRDGEKTICREQVRYEGGPAVSEWDPCTPVLGYRQQTQSLNTLTPVPHVHTYYTRLHDLLSVS